MSQPLNSEILRNVTTLDNGIKVKIPDFVKCYVCHKPPEGANWLIGVRDPRARKFVHINSCQGKI